MLSFFEKLVAPFPDMPPNRPPDSLWAFCWYYTKGVWPLIALMSSLVMLVAVVEVFLFSFLGDLVDWLSTANRETFLVEEGSKLWAIGALVVLGIPLLSLMSATVRYQGLMGNYPMRIRWMAHQYLLRQSFGFYQDEFAGRIATKVMQTALGVRDVIMKLADVMVYVVVYFLGALILVATFDPLLMLPFLIWLGLYLALMSRLLPKLHQIAKSQADARSTMTGRIVDSYTNIMTVKLFSHTREEEAYARSSMREFLVTVYKMMRLGTRLEVSVDTLNGLLLFSVGFIGIGSWLNETASLGAIAVAVALVLRLQGMSHWLMWELSSLFENLGMAHDGMSTLSKVHSVTDLAGAKSLTVERGSIEFRAITFAYDDQQPVIENLDLTIKPGERIGLVGRSGAGKTTLVNTLLRLFDISSGSILIDGQNIAEVQQETLRAHIGVVTQDTALLHRSIAENIAYGRKDATQEEIEAAAKRANAHDFIMGLKDLDGREGYDAHVGERGAKLSGGQRQRIAIARMLLKDAPILILDEATSALDSEVEAAIQDNLMQLMSGKTVVAIAHRLSTIAAMDRLIVMDQGRIIEQGSHKALIAAGGLYAELWQRQTGGFVG